MAGIYQKLPKPFFVLAPMYDVTDTVFRRVIADCASPDLYVTEFVSVDGLQSAGRGKLLKYLKFTQAERPIIAQIWGKNPENYYKTAKELVGMGFDGIDINMGCPDKTIVKNGCCAALINNRELAAEIIQATREGLATSPAGTSHMDAAQGGSEARNEPYKTYGEVSTGASNTAPRHDRQQVGSSAAEQAGGVHVPAGEVGTPLPLSVKTRLGLSEIDLSWHEFLLSKKLNALSIHGRTAKQMSKVPADWDKINEIRILRDKLSPDTVVIGNGDVLTRQQGLTLAKKYKTDGVMIGRGVLSDPFAFAEPSPWNGFTKEQRISLYRRHVELFAATYQYEERKVHGLYKFCKIYIQGFEGAKELREQLMGAKSATELSELLSKAMS